MAVQSTRSWAHAVLHVFVVLLVLMASAPQLARVRAQNCGPTAAGSKCGGNNCCSKFGFCGTGNDYCGDGCKKGYGHCNNGCFPGSAAVLLRSGIEKQISELSIGDEVAVWIGKDGLLEYDKVYADGHMDASALSEFVSITLRNGNITKKLQLTSDHFVPLVVSQGNLQFARAKDVVVGDKMIAIHEQGQEFLVVVALDKEMLRGLFNPFTLRGTILVNKVLASCHSDWFLDSTFDSIGLSHLLPPTYQAILTPIRMIYKIMGEEAYKSFYKKIDSEYNIAEEGSHVTGYLKLLKQAILSTANKGIGKHP